MSKLSISNIAWNVQNDNIVYDLMKKYSYSGIEIAPTRVFLDKPYDNLENARSWSEIIFKKFNLKISSMQSIWYGKNEKIFGSAYERQILINYTKKAIDFAKAIRCKNLVFGCPKNRVISDECDIEAAEHFFKELGDYACANDCVLAMEANPRIYNTNFLNTTEEAMDFIERVDSSGFLLNLDTGTMIENKEDIEQFRGREYLINHIHISEPYLKPIKPRKLHTKLASMLKDIDYQGFVSIEVGLQDDMVELSKMMEYVKGIFG